MFILKKCLYMSSWEIFNKTSLPDKEAFHSNLHMEDIADVDHRHANNVFKKFILKHFGEYHDLYVQSDKLLLAMYLIILETCVLKYMNFILFIFFCTRISMTSMFKENRGEIRIVN